MTIYLRNWYDKLLNELNHTKRLRIISPFVKEHVIRKIASTFDLKNFELITRFNLRDFASNVSSLDGLKFGVENGASIYGIKDLHSKIYLFDDKAAIVSSANLTNGGLVNNYECGIYLTDNTIVKQLHGYFDELQVIADQKLNIEQCESWQQQITEIEIYNTKTPSLPDYGASEIKIDKSKNYYIKFFGTADNRVPLSFSSEQEVERALCHYACGFSINKKPRRFRDGDIIYLARMTYEPTDYAIFGKAEAIRFVDERDKASKSEIEERPWKANWPIYLRLKNPVFINGTMGDCVSLYDLIKKFSYESFPSTKDRYDKGERQINPYLSLSQQAYIKITPDAAEWLEARFQGALYRVGKIDSTFINSLPKANIQQ